MDKLDTWVHIIEVIVVVFLIPAMKTLVTTLLALQTSILSLKQTVDSHTEAFEEHVHDDKAKFDRLDNRVGDVAGDIREIRGLLALDRRSGLERRTE